MFCGGGANRKGAALWNALRGWLQSGFCGYSNLSASSTAQGIDTIAACGRVFVAVELLSLSFLSVAGVVEGLISVMGGRADAKGKWEG